MLLPEPIKQGRGEGEEKDFSTRLSDAIALGGGPSTTPCLQLQDVGDPEKNSNASGTGDRGRVVLAWGFSGHGDTEQRSG